MTPEILTRFAPDPGYLNTATMGAPPLATLEAMSAAMDEWRRGLLQGQDFDDDVNRSRAAWASIVGVDAALVATSAAASQLVGIVAESLLDDAVVLTAEGDFTSVLFPFLAQCGRGVTVLTVPLEEITSYPGLLDGTVDLVAVSAVQSADGHVIDLDALAQAGTDTGARILLDVTQACGWLPVDASRFDYVVCSAYKWLLSPRGTAFMYVRAEHLDTLRPTAAGWYAGDDPWTSIYGSPLRLAPDARRFDLSPSWLSWRGAVPALELLAGIDMAAVQAHDVGLADLFLAQLGRPGQGSAIVTVDSPGAAERLAAAGIRTAVRAGRVRASFHLYNTEADAVAAATALRST